jgi:uncharacterized protein (TIGR03437 family)
MRVSSFLPADYVTDGSVDYSSYLNAALNSAAGTGQTLIFDPITYGIGTLNAITIPSNTKVSAAGARFVASAAFSDTPPGQDGSFFVATTAQHVLWDGGDFEGSRDQWYEGTNINALRFDGSLNDITVQNATIRNFSAPGVFVRGTAASPATNISVLNCTFDRDSAIYRDYLSPDPGPAKDSTDADKGQALIHYASNVVFQSNTVTNSLGDGVYIRWTSNASIEANQINASNMGGLLLTTCTNATVQGNTFNGNGSRNITVEWGSQQISIFDNTIENGGREGVWGDGFYSGRVADNIFITNGRKHDLPDDTDLSLNRWGNGAPAAQLAQMPPESAAVTIEGNIFHTGADQSHAVCIGSGLAGAVLEYNVFSTPHAVRAGAFLSGDGQVVVRDNSGWVTENSGEFQAVADGATRTYSFAHGLSFSDPSDPRMLNVLQIDVRVAAVAQISVTADTTDITVTYAVAPPAGTTIDLKWSAAIVAPYYSQYAVPMRVTSSASFLTGPVAPGELITIFGANIGPNILETGSYGSAGDLTRTIEGVQVFINDEPAPMVQASVGQVSAIVPYGVSGAATVRVEGNGQQSDTEALRVTDAVPAIFCYSAGTGTAVAINTRASGATSFNNKTPASRNDFLTFFVTGSGDVTPAIADGMLPVHGQNPRPATPVQVFVGGIESTCADNWAGLIDAGVLQVNACVPENAPSGAAVPLSVTIGNASSQPGVTVWIQ